MGVNHMAEYSFFFSYGTWFAHSYDCRMVYIHCNCKYRTWGRVILISSRLQNLSARLNAQGSSWDKACRTFIIIIIIIILLLLVLLLLLLLSYCVYKLYKWKRKLHTSIADNIAHSLCFCFPFFVLISSLMVKCWPLHQLYDIYITVETHITTNPAWQPTLNYGHFVSKSRKKVTPGRVRRSTCYATTFVPVPAGRISGFRLYNY